MRDHFFSLDPHRSLIAAKSTLAIVIGYGIGLAFDWKASSIAVTIIVLQTATVGTTFNKSALRMIGTLVGAMVGLAVVGLCAHDRDHFIVAMALVTAICVWRMQVSAHQYAWMLLMLTCAIVGWPTAMNPLNAFQTSVDRVTAVTIGVILSGIVHGVFWPVTSGKQFERAMHDVVTGCQDLSSMVRRGLLEQDMDISAIGAKEIKLLSLSSSLPTTLTAARADSRRFREHYAQYQGLCDELADLVLAASAIGATATVFRKQLMATAESQKATLQLLDSWDKACAATVKQLSMPHDRSDREPDSRPAVDLDLADFRAVEVPDKTVEILRDNVRSFEERVARVRAELSHAEVAGSSERSHRSVAKAIPAIKGRLKKTVLAALQVIVGAGFFILLDWPLGIQSAMILIMIFAYLNAQLPVSLVAANIFKSTLIALPVAAVFHFVLMPRLDSFTELAPWLALLFFPMLYGVSSRNPLTSMSAMLAVNLVNSLISISAAPPKYDFASFANTYLGMGGGIAVVFLLAYLFETRSPRRALQGLLSTLLSQSADYLAQLEDGSSRCLEGSANDKGPRRQWLQQLEQMKKLSTTVDYRQAPHATREQINAVLRTCDALVARLIWPSMLSYAHNAESENEARSLTRAREWCARTLATTATAVDGCQQIAIQPPDDVFLGDLASRGTRQSIGSHEGAVGFGDARVTVSVYYRSLAEAITDCQREVNNVDWQRWSQGYF